MPFDFGTYSLLAETSLIFFHASFRGKKLKQAEEICQSLVEKSNNKPGKNAIVKQIDYYLKKYKGSETFSEALKEYRDFTNKYCDKIYERLSLMSKTNVEFFKGIESKTNLFLFYIYNYNKFTNLNRIQSDFSSDFTKLLGNYFVHLYKAHRITAIQRRLTESENKLKHTESKSKQLFMGINSNEMNNFLEIVRNISKNFKNTEDTPFEKIDLPETLKWEDITLILFYYKKKETQKIYIKMAFSFKDYQTALLQPKEFGFPNNHDSKMFNLLIAFDRNNRELAAYIDGATSKTEKYDKYTYEELKYMERKPTQDFKLKDQIRRLRGFLRKVFTQNGKLLVTEHNPIGDPRKDGKYKLKINLKINYHL